MLREATEPKCKQIIIMLYESLYLQRNFDAISGFSNFNERLTSCNLNSLTLALIGVGVSRPKAAANHDLTSG